MQMLITSHHLDDSNEMAPVGKATYTVPAQIAVSTETAQGNSQNEEPVSTLCMLCSIIYIPAQPIMYYKQGSSDEEEYKQPATEGPPRFILAGTESSESDWDG